MNAVPATPEEQARDFYRGQLQSSFRWSRPFSSPRGVMAEQIVDTPECESILRECSPGSLDCARRIGELVVVRLDPVAAGPWWRDLLNYERAWFLQSATTAEGPPTNRPRRGVSSMCLSFVWNTPELIKRLQSGQDTPEELRQPVTLVFSRGPEGRVFVAQVSPEIERVFRATNGLRTAEQIARTAGATVDQTLRVLDSLAGIGAVVPAMSPASMIQQIEAREEKS
jgi:hypothetical protein